MSLERHPILRWLALVAVVLGAVAVAVAVPRSPSAAAPTTALALGYDGPTRHALLRQLEPNVSSVLAMPRDSRPGVIGIGRALLVAGVAAEETAAGTRSVDEVLNGLPRGKQGFVRTVPDEATLQSTFEELTQGGTPTTWKGYGGDVFELPDGTQIGLRGTSRSGGSTIDLRIPGQDPFRIHIG